MESRNFNPHHRKVVTRCLRAPVADGSDFNPHHRKVVTSVTAKSNYAWLISIHTTARWWRPNVNVSFDIRKFQSTPPQGGDRYVKKFCLIICISIHTTARWWPRKQSVLQSLTSFQSTPPQGGDKRRSCLNDTDTDFNPHHRKVVTEYFLGHGTSPQISIHTTARWWLVGKSVVDYMSKFQSTPPQGGDVLMLDSGLRQGISIHTTARWW